MNIDVSTFRQAFFEEAEELLADFEDGLLRLEESPTDRELLNTIFRCAHSLKGGSSTFGIPEIASFTHGLETLLDRVREGEVAVTDSLCRVLLDSLDHLRILLDAATGSQVAVPDATDLDARIIAACDGGSNDAGPASQAPHVADHAVEGEDFGLWATPKRFHLHFFPGPDVLKSGCDPLLFIRNLGQIAEVVDLKCDASRLPALEALDPQTCYVGWEIDLVSEHSTDELLEVFDFIADESDIVLTATESAGAESDQPELEPEAPRPAATGKAPSVSTTTPSANAPSKSEATSLRVSAEKVDRLINLVGELVISQSMLNSVTADFEMSRLPRLQEAVAQMERASRELQERVMGIRLLQIKMAFGRFPRLVHDLSSAVGKKIELKLSGEETELDKNLIEAIGDPLTHLVRNSIDHGLETPDERKKAGKNPVGTLTISAFHEGGSIVIEVADDGRGLRRDKILSKAVERELVSSEDVLTDEQVYNLIFLPGFSTAEKVTDLSGRGVGMDIVKQAIAAIGGSIKVTSKPGEGVCTRIRLPLTMAILEGQSMSVGDNVYIIPLTSIVESIRPTQDDIHAAAHIGELVSVRGEFLPVVRLYQVFDQEPLITNPWEGSLVLVESEGRKVAIMADDLIGQGQVVIKSLETNYRKVEGIAGATILGDGRVALIIDVPGLLRGTHEHGTMHQAA